MKNTVFLALAIATISLPAAAQTEKGTKYLGIGVGNLNYQSADYLGSNSSQLSAALHPAAGVFVADNILVGGNLTLGYDRLSFERGNYRRRTIEYGVAPFARAYFPGASAHRFFGQLSAGITWNDTRIKNYYNYPDPNLLGANGNYKTAGVALGYNYFLTPGAALEVTAGYNRSKYNRASSSYGELDVRVGFSVFLPSK